MKLTKVSLVLGLAATTMLTGCGSFKEIRDNQESSKQTLYSMQVTCSEKDGDCPAMWKAAKLWGQSKTGNGFRIEIEPVSRNVFIGLRWVPPKSSYRNGYSLSMTKIGDGLYRFNFVPICKRPEGLQTCYPFWADLGVAYKNYIKQYSKGAK